ncbi:SPOR domain-containing protein [Devosia nitrariae]|uniref:SPOR domain-containing protein n=1 Tax=Devosia nitrariae TaxID=2071872 RepID=UPI0024E08B46|nr:SPOR domain-containing protein [Devosia nitrariae]
MNDQPEAADDLIAELAKLMAHDAQGDRKDKAPEPEAVEEKPSQAFAPAVEPQPAVEPPAADPAPAAPTPFTFRMPGDAAPTHRDPVPAPRFDFSTTPAPNPAAPSASGSAAPAPAEPFAFDFGLNRPAPAATPQTSEEAYQADPQATEAASAAEEQDAIGDLIAAELSQEIDAAQDQFPNEAEAEQATAPPAMTIRNEPQVSAPEAGPREASDDFRVAPVFGLGGPSSQVEPAAPPVRNEPAAGGAQAGSASQDPISDIESLIGDAVRVQREAVAPRADVEPKTGETRMNASPALRSLATPVLPQSPAAQRSTPVAETVAMSAEDTILAAAEASGAQVDWADTHEVATDFEPSAIGEEPHARVRRGGGLLRAFAGPAIAVALLLAAGVGLYSVLGLGGGNDGPAPLLTADAGPVKEVPETAADAEPEPQSVVFSEIAGTATPAEDEQLVSRDQSQTTEVAALPTDEASAEGLVNRKVRTVTVRPDGTIVGGEDSVAGAAMLPVDRPNVPAVPGAEQATRAITVTEGETPAPAETQAAAASPADTTGAAVGQTGTDATDPVAELIATAPTDPAAPANAAAETPATNTATSGATAPVPMPRIERPSAPSTVTTVADTPSQPFNAVIQGTLQPVAPQAPAQQAAVNQQQSSAPAYVQLSSQRSQEAAKQTATSLQTRFGNLFGGTSLEIQRVDLGERGIYYRVRLPAQSLQSATQICNSVKSGGGDCFTL